MDENQNFQENDLIESVSNNDNSKISLINFNELLEEFENTMKVINGKIYVGKENSNSNTEEGVFKDLENSFGELNKIYLNLISYFKDPPNEKEKEILNRTASFKKTMKDFVDLADEIEKISLNEKLKNYNEEINKFCNIVEHKLSHNATNYGNFVDNFVKNNQEKLNLFSEIFFKMIKNTTRFFYSLIFLSMGLGLILGALFFLIYVKNTELNNLKERINLITQGAGTISVDENNKNITLSFAKNKKTIFTEDKNSIQITLQGGE
ncbi:hypothetical protein [Campylobacter insulaenigrae]|uniref:hypothetical protein n=1 Tax=Campylobacter insulaenigrae TaxID=260714 RepID=UPI002153A06D|nr:hypothetical protein [Campylobacter insulaenigrae]MCR6580353.1 hypothetical protein [Campylobacter insulaenigrae]